MSNEDKQEVIDAVQNNSKLLKDFMGNFFSPLQGWRFSVDNSDDTDITSADFLEPLDTLVANKTPTSSAPQASASRDQEDDRDAPKITPKSFIDNANRAFTRDQLSDEESTKRSGLFASISGFASKSKKSSEDIDEELNRERGMKQSSPLPNANAGNQNSADNNENLEDDLKKVWQE